jgi:DNA-binding LacI/PurR family transcriptional regulator
VGCYKAAIEMTKRFTKDSPNRPTAIIIMVDTFANPVERAFISQGWRVPDDISIISTVSEPIGEFSEVPVTSIQVDRDGSRLKALNRIFDKINTDTDTHTPVRYFVPPRLKIRKSTSKIVSRLGK